MSTNLSQQKREKLLKNIKIMREKLKDNPELITSLANIESELKRKKYGLVWEEHEERVDEELKTKIPVFKEDKKLEIKLDENKPINFLIEGDNLHSLYLLEKTHKEKIDVIYIDPPYNTGNKDFIYDDNFVNSEDGYKHSKWLSFMEKRLIIAKELLKSNGAIFISIDDNEQSQLKLLCDEIFGENNFVATFPYQKRTAKSDVPNGVSQDYEWVLCYSKNKAFFKAYTKGKERKYYESEDLPNRPWRIHDMSTQRTANERPNSDFDMVDPKTNKVYPVNKNAVWRITKDSFNTYYKQNRIVFPDDYDFLNISKPVFRYFKEDDEKKAGKTFGCVAVSTKFPVDIGMNKDGTKEIADLFKEKVFAYPKPVSLIKYLVKIATYLNDNAIILDFFAGSGTTGQAVVELNEEEGKNKSFILCTNNENEICRKITYKRLEKICKGTDKFDAKKLNLKYYKTDYINRFNYEDEKYYITNELSKYIQELVKLENGIDIDNREVQVLFTDEEIDNFSKNKELVNACNLLYVDTNVLITEEQMNIFEENNITILYIPEYYFEDEIMEVEQW